MDCCQQSTGVQEEESILELKCRPGLFRVSATTDLARWMFFASLEASDPHMDVVYGKALVGKLRASPKPSF